MLLEGLFFPSRASKCDQGVAVFPHVSRRVGGVEGARVHGGWGGAASQPPTQSLGQYRVAVMVVAVVGVVASQCVSRAKQMNAFRASKIIVAAEYCTSRPLMLSERTAVSIHVRSILIH